MKITFSTKDIINQSFRKRVGMFTGELTLKSVFLYLNTYRWALLNHGIKDIDEPDFHKFHEFIKDKFGFFESTAGWKNMIVAISLGFNGNMLTWSWEMLLKRELEMTQEEHQSSLILFFTLFDEFYDIN